MKVEVGIGAVPATPAMAIAQGGQQASVAVPMSTTAVATMAAPTTAVLTAVAVDHPQDPPPSPYTSHHHLLFPHYPIMSYAHLHFHIIKLFCN